MKKILVPTDFSLCAIKALDYAISIAKKATADIILLHACELIHNPFADRQTLIDKHNQVLENERMNQLKVLKESIEEKHALQVITKLYDGDTIDSIDQAAQRETVDLIVMGTLGQTGLQKMIFGSRTAAIISTSPIPVITIPYQYEWSEPKKILLALNDPTGNITVLKPVFEIADLFGAEITAAIFTGSHKEGVEFMEHSRSIHTIQENLEKAYGNTIVNTVHLSGDDFQETIQKYIKETQTDLLAMVTHKRKAIDNLFNKSMTRKMGYHATIPLLSVHAEK